MSDDQTVTWLGATYTREYVRHAFAQGFNVFTGSPADPNDPRVLAARAASTPRE